MLGGNIHFTLNLFFGFHMFLCQSIVLICEDYLLLMNALCQKKKLLYLRVLMISLHAHQIQSSYSCNLINRSAIQCISTFQWTHYLHTNWIYLIKNCEFGFIKLQVKSMLKCNLIKLSAIHALHFINNQQHYSTNLMHPMTNHSELKELQ